MNLVNHVNQATNYLTSHNKYDILFTVNITCMMVLASIYLSVSASLPNTYGIKPVEIWLLFNLAYPFQVILVNICLQVSLSALPQHILQHYYPIHFFRRLKKANHEM